MWYKWSLCFLSWTLGPSQSSRQPSALGLHLEVVESIYNQIGQPISVCSHHSHASNQTSWDKKNTTWVGDCKVNREATCQWTAWGMNITTPQKLQQVKCNALCCSHCRLLLSGLSSQLLTNTEHSLTPLGLPTERTRAGCHELLRQVERNTS